MRCSWNLFDYQSQQWVVILDLKIFRTKCLGNRTRNIRKYGGHFEAYQQ